jgi:hypothetical protein
MPAPDVLADDVGGDRAAGFRFDLCRRWVKNGLPSKHNSMAASHSTAEVSGGLFASSKEQGGVTGGDRMNGTRDGSAAIAAPAVLSFFCFVQGPWALNEAAPPSA